MRPAGKGGAKTEPAHRARANVGADALGPGTESSVHDGAGRRRAVLCRNVRVRPARHPVGTVRHAKGKQSHT